MGGTCAACRLDIHLIFQQILAGKTTVNMQNVSREFMLYTDTDVIWYKDFTTCSVSPPALLAFGAEWAHNTTCNAGMGGWVGGWLAGWLAGWLRGGEGVQQHSKSVLGHAADEHACMGGFVSQMERGQPIDHLSPLLSPQV
jgi:hypothetical protein